MIPTCTWLKSRVYSRTYQGLVRQLFFKGDVFSVIGCEFAAVSLCQYLPIFCNDDTDAWVCSSVTLRDALPCFLYGKLRELPILRAIPNPRLRLGKAERIDASLPTE